MAFRTNAAPYQRAKNSTLKIMLILFAALAVVWVFGIVYSFKLDGIVNGAINSYNDYANTFNENNATLINMGIYQAKVLRTDFVNYGVRSILMVVIALATTAICDVVTTLVKHKKDSKESLGKEIVNDLIHNYSWVSAIIFALTVPVYTSYYVIIIGSIFATVVVKNFFGGFGKNIFNPAIMARIFVGLCFASQLGIPDILVEASTGIGGVKEVAGVIAGIKVDGTTGATLTTAFNNTSGWLGTTYSNGIQTVFGGIFADYTMMDMLLGNYVGALGETFTLVIFVLGIALSVLKVINWRTPVFYLGTVALTALVIALVCGFANPLQYVVYHLALGGVMFGAVFMLTDPVTGPTSPYGKSLVAVFAGLMTVLIRVKGGYPEGVMYSIALCNFISPAVDYLTTGKSGAHMVRKVCGVVGTLVVSIALCTGLSVSANGGVTRYEINGVDRVQYAMLTETLNLNEGDELAPIENYTAKTANVKELILDKENNISLAPAYEVKNGGTVVAKAYIVSVTYSIYSGHANEDITSYALVAINNDGTIYGISVLKPLNTAGFGLEGSINETFTTEYVGKDATNYTDKDLAYVAGATYSSKFMKEIISAAYAEFNA